MSNKPAVKAFLTLAGPPPWPCDECGVLIYGIGHEFDSLVHHHDEDRTNNVLENLRPMHRPCHGRHHHAGMPRSAETRQKISERTTGVPKTYDPEVAEKLAASRRGRKDSEETTRRRSEASRAAWARRKEQS